MSREGTKRKRWKDIPLGRKVLLAVVSIMLLMLGINIILYSQVNKTIRRMDTVYSSNVDLTELSDSLSNVQESLYGYLSVKTSDSLESYYRSEQTYRNLLEKLEVRSHQIPPCFWNGIYAECQSLIWLWQRRRCLPKGEET